MRRLQPPLILDDPDFAFVWDKDTDEYVLSLRSGQSFDLGDAALATNYFSLLRIPGLERKQVEELGERAINCARNFHVAIVIVEEGRVFGAETKESGLSVNQPLKKKDGELLIV